MADKESHEGAYDMTLDVELDGVPNAPFDTFAFTVNLSSVYRVDPDAAAELEAMNGMEIDPSDTETVAKIVTTLVNGVNTYQSLNIQFPPDVADALGAQMGAPLPADITVNYAIVDGIGYLDLDSVAASFPEAEGLTGWVGTELAPIIEEALAQAADNPDAQSALAPAMMGMAGQQMAEQQKEVFQQFSDIQRLDDEVVDGADTAVFESTFDFVSFASDPAFFELVGQQLAAMGEDAPSPADLAQAQFMMPMIAPMLFGGLDFTTTEYIDLETGYTTLGEMTFAWDLSALGNLAAMAGQDMSGLPSFFGMWVTVDSSDQGDAGDIEAPEGAMVVPAESIVASMQQ
ncbi:MAG: hypothetical protein R2854_24200 [Caldilineaceae bacterium]